MFIGCSPSEIFMKQATVIILDFFSLTKPMAMQIPGKSIISDTVSVEACNWSIENWMRQYIFPSLIAYINFLMQDQSKKDSYAQDG